ncbi:Eukaryotic translation initiation factor 3 subunit E-A, partial [Xenoophorus captivus]
QYRSSVRLPFILSPVRTPDLFIFFINSMLADKLNMSPEEAERWIVNLIRNARLDAKIDSKLGHVVMGNNAISPYQQVIEKTKSLSFRSQMLVMNIEKKQASSNRNEVSNALTTHQHSLPACRCRAHITPINLSD